MCSSLCYVEKDTVRPEDTDTGTSTGPGNHVKCSALCAHNYVFTCYAEKPTDSTEGASTGPGNHVKSESGLKWDYTCKSF